MKRRATDRWLTARQVVELVGDAPLDDEECRERLRAKLASLGLDPVDWVRARAALKLGRKDLFLRGKD